MVPGALLLQIPGGIGFPELLVLLMLAVLAVVPLAILVAVVAGIWYFFVRDDGE